MNLPAPHVRVLGAILDVLAAYCLSLVEQMGYAGVFFLMVLESMVFPVPSEAVLPPAGWLAFEGRMSFWLALAAATLGTVVGSLLSYAMGWYGMRPVLERWGKYVFVTPHHLEMTSAFFEKRGAGWAVFLSRFVPVVRHLSSIPAGSARMPLTTFVAATAAGGLLWNATLLFAGYKLGENWQTVTHVIEDSKLAILGTALVLLAAIGTYAYAGRRRKRAAAA